MKSALTLMSLKYATSDHKPQTSNYFCYVCMIMQKITPFLWFDSQAEEAAKFYCSIFKDSRILHSSPMVVSFELKGQQFMGLNGGPRFKFTEAISFFVNCKDQQEV